jgi:exportin-1
MDSIVWAIKHTMRDIADTGLNRKLLMFLSCVKPECPWPRVSVCLEVVNNFADADPVVANAFFQQYFLSIVQDIFFVLTDTDHKSGFKLQSLLLARMFQLVEGGELQTLLYDPAALPENMTNSIFLKEFTANLLKTAFPHVLPYAYYVFLMSSASFTRSPSIIFRVQVQVFVNGLSDYHSDINRFKLALRDFLIQLKEFSSGDNAELFLEEKEAEAQRKAQQERENAMRIPGMLKPSQIKDEDEDI